MKLPQDWVCPDWPAPANVRSFVTGRSGGMSRGRFATFNVGDATGDDPSDVAENKRRLLAMVPSEPRWLRQVHGPVVVDAQTVIGPVDADAAVTRAPGVVCVVKIADCMPVLLCDTGGTVAAAAHAGWRGLAAGVVENTIAAMQCDPARLLAFLGPAIGPGAFEVGDEVRDAFVAFDAQASSAFAGHRPGKWMADLFALARMRLARAGVQSVYGGGLCTVTNPHRFYSYRRDGITGRMAALIWLAANAS